MSKANTHFSEEPGKESLLPVLKMPESPIHTRSNVFDFRLFHPLTKIKGRLVEHPYLRSNPVYIKKPRIKIPACSFYYRILMIPLC
jgi:hypothetical protein